MKVYAIGRVYKIENTIDDKLYVGSTVDTLSRRMVGHRAAIKKGKEFPLYIHMRANGVENFNIILLEQMENINKENLRAREDHWIKQLDTVKNGLNGRYEDGGICQHNKRRELCKECGGGSICEHNRQRSQCKDCGGSQICEHNKRRDRCKDCGGASICEHNRLKNQCKDCGGSQICEHNRLKNQCKDCGGSQICEHNRQRSHCKECGGSLFCEHNKQKNSCKECNGDKYKCNVCNKIYGSKYGIDYHNKTKHQ